MLDIIFTNGMIKFNRKIELLNLLSYWIEKISPLLKPNSYLHSLKPNPNFKNNLFKLSFKDPKTNYKMPKLTSSDLKTNPI